MEKMKKRIIALFVLVLFLLSSCVGNNTDTETQSGGMVYSSLIILNEINRDYFINSKCKGIEMNIGVGQSEKSESHGLSYYQSVTLEIYAPDFTIELPDGSTADEEYIMDYSEFDNEKYRVRWDRNGDYVHNLKFEKYRFIYKGDECIHKGKISIYLIHYEEQDNCEETERKAFSDLTSVSVYYYVYGSIIKISEYPLLLK